MHSDEHASAMNSPAMNCPGMNCPSADVGRRAIGGQLIALPWANQQDTLNIEKGLQNSRGSCCLPLPRDINYTYLSCCFGEEGKVFLGPF